MDRYEIDGMVVDQIVYWWDQPAVYLGRILEGDGRPCLVLLIEDSQHRQTYHRLTFADERGLRRTFASGVTASSTTYDLAVEFARLVSVTGDEKWTTMTRDELLCLDGPPTSVAPGRASGHVDMSRWSSDHWMLLRYLADRAGKAPKGGPATIEYARLRINRQNHLVQFLAISEWGLGEKQWSRPDSTRLDAHDEAMLTGDPDKIEEAMSQVPYHDDFDCIEEMEDEGLLEIISTARGEFTLTSSGARIATLIEAHITDHGSIHGFRLGADKEETE